MSRRNKRFILTKKRLLALSALFFSLGLVTSITSTLAWYAIRSEMAIGNLNLRIHTDPNTYNLEFWLQNENTDEKFYPDAKNGGFTKQQLGIENALLCDVSGMYQDAWNGKDLPTFRSAYRSSGNNKQTADQKQATKREDGGERINYVQNVFYFKSNFSGEIYLTKTTTDYEYIGTAHDINLEKADSDVDKADKLDKVIEAVRISYFTDEGYIITQRSYHETYYCGPLDIDGDGYYDYNTDGEEILYGEIDDDDEKKQAVDEKRYLDLDGKSNEDSKIKNNFGFTVSDSDYSTFTAKTKAGKIPVAKDAYKNFGKKEESHCWEDYMYYTESGNPKDYLEKTKICSLEPNVPKRVVVSVYIEGWDKDMTDQIADATFEINIAFTALIKD